jgi:ATP-dependent DNA ligase
MKRSDCPVRKDYKCVVRACACVFDRIHARARSARQLFQPVKPMLAQRLQPNAVIEAMQNSPFAIETKYDGERIQVRTHGVCVSSAPCLCACAQTHKEGDVIRLFTRNANEYTRMYSTVLPLLNKALSYKSGEMRIDKYVCVMFRVLLSIYLYCCDACVSCIIDGELVLWDTVRQQFEPFGNLKTFAKYGLFVCLFVCIEGVCLYFADTTKE